MAADHEKEEDEGWTRGLMQGFQAAGQKYRSTKLMPNLSSAFLIIMLLQLVTPDHKLLLISFPRLSSNLLQKNTPDYRPIPNVSPPFLFREKFIFTFQKFCTTSKRKFVT